ncbi:MAG: Fic family protein [Planctomycetota bacterium]
MKRGPTGTYDSMAVAGEVVRAFVPSPLPPVPPVVLTGRLQLGLERAQLALGRLDSVSTLLPGPRLFLYSYVRKEALLSSQIEGTQSSLSDLLIYELAQAPGAPIDDVVEVANYVAALEHGLQRLRGGFPLSGRLLREIHHRLLALGRGSSKEPGEYRRSQNWIGGTRPGNAAFVPPPAARVAECMGELERFLHGQSDLPVLVRAALAHVQFETIHPFLDGNGRLGRLLIVLMLVDGGILRQPLLYLSLFFKQHRSRYYELLNEVRQQGDWEAWIAFFLEGVESTAAAAVDSAHRLLDLFRIDEMRLTGLGRSGTSLRQVYAALRQRPLVGIPQLAARAQVSFPTAAKAIERLVALGIAREVTGGRRNRVFAYDAYLTILGEGAEPL